MTTRWTRITLATGGVLIFGWGVVVGMALDVEMVQPHVPTRWIVDEQTTTVELDDGEVDCVIRGRADQRGVVEIELIRCGEGRRRGDG